MKEKHVFKLLVNWRAYTGVFNYKYLRSMGCRLNSYHLPLYVLFVGWVFSVTPSFKLFKFIRVTEEEA